MSLKCKYKLHQIFFNTIVGTEALTNPLRSEELSPLSTKHQDWIIGIMNIAEPSRYAIPNNAKG